MHRDLSRLKNYFHRLSLLPMPLSSNVCDISVDMGLNCDKIDEFSVVEWNFVIEDYFVDYSTMFDVENVENKRKKRREKLQKEKY